MHGSLADGRGHVLVGLPRARKGMVPAPDPRDALEGKGPRRRPQQRFHRRLEEVAEAVGGVYCRLQMPLRLALAVRDSGWA